MSNLIVPFDNNPATTAIKTSSYTVPTGKYALVTAIHPDLTLNGSLVFNSRSFSVTGHNSTNSVSLGVVGNVYLTGTFSTSGSYEVNVSGSVAIGHATGGTYTIASWTTASPGSSFSLTPQMASSPLVAISASGVEFSGVHHYGTMNVTYYSFSGDKTSFWVQAGVVLGGSKYVIEEYNAIS